MRSFWSDPYLWIHLAGLAALPLFLELCLVGLAIGDPILPVWLELLLVAVAGAAPILWMQLQQPFYIFSVVAIALKPERLTDDQRRLLTLFKSRRNQVLAALAPIVLLVALRQLYIMAPIAAPVIPVASAWRGVGLLVAAVAFLGCNLFLQVPISVASVMLTDEASFATAVPYSIEQIRQNFTLLGWHVNQILPPIIRAEPVSPAVPFASSTVSSGTVSSGTVSSNAAPGTITDADETEGAIELESAETETRISLAEQNPAIEVTPPPTSPDWDSSTAEDSITSSDLS